MRRLVLAGLMLLAALPVRAQSTFLELGLYWGSFSGAQVTNATTTLANSKGGRHRHRNGRLATHLSAGSLRRIHGSRHRACSEWASGAGLHRDTANRFSSARHDVQDRELRREVCV